MLNRLKRTLASRRTIARHDELSHAPAVTCAARRPAS